MQTIFIVNIPSQKLHDSEKFLSKVGKIAGFIKTSSCEGVAPQPQQREIPFVIP
jgi:hypothetical protein